MLPSMSEPYDPQASHAGQAAYSPWVLRIYDWFVLGFSCTFAWRCPSRVLLDHYQRHVGTHHLDVGVGSGYFLDNCRFPVPEPRIALLDLNQSSLTFTARRIARLSPRTYCFDVLQPLPVDETYDSIGLGFLLHCLPGDMDNKATALANLAPVLRDDGVLFGSTILGSGVSHNALGKALMRTYNRKGIFSNLHDSEESLRNALERYFSEVTIKRHGTVGLFAARRPRR
jgi:ubiquinone/menaquinone biosynthesis C-methylase UbiE